MDKVHIVMIPNVVCHKNFFALASVVSKFILNSKVVCIGLPGRPTGQPYMSKLLDRFAPNLILKYTQKFMW